jgi:hypothetical protein
MAAAGKMEIVRHGHGKARTDTGRLSIAAARLPSWLFYARFSLDRLRNGSLTDFGE